MSPASLFRLEQNLKQGVTEVEEVPSPPVLLDYLHAYNTVSEARDGIGRYFDAYNRTRPHSSWKGMTPDQPYYSSPPLTLTV